MIKMSSSSRQDNTRLPELDCSFGVGLRREHYETISTAEVDFLELVTENFMSFGGKSKALAQEVSRQFPVVLHGVGLSIGSPDPLNEEYLSQLEALIELTNPRWFSDHLSYSSAFGVEYHDLIPLPFSKGAIDHVVPRIQEIQNRFSIPFLLENPSYYVTLPGSDRSEAAFFSEIVKQSECGILLDINNVYVNATNHGYDPIKFLEEIPLEKVAQVHIAGHDSSGKFLVDTHGAAVPDEVFALYSHLTRIAPKPFWTLLEWDHSVPSQDDLMKELEKVRQAAQFPSTFLTASNSPKRQARERS